VQKRLLRLRARFESRPFRWRAMSVTSCGPFERQP